MKTHITKKSGLRKGQIFLFFLTLTTIALLLSVGILTLDSITYRTTRIAERKRDALFLAEAGIDKAYQSFAANPTSYTGETLTLGNGTATVSVVAGSTANEKYLVSTGTVSGQSRRIRVKLAADPNASAISFGYALQAGAGGFSMGNGSTISGSVYSNGNITGSNGASVTGNATAVGTITNLSVGGTKKTGASSQPMPTFDEAFWKSKAQVHVAGNGLFTPIDGSTIGPLYVNGGLVFSNNSTVTIKGPVYATNGITFGNSPTINVDNSLGNNGTMLFTDGIITFGNGITINSNASGGDLLLISMSNLSNAINIANGAITVNGPLYAPNGTITIGNSAHAVAFAGNTVAIGNNAVVTYDTGLASESYTYGPGGGWTLQKGSYQEY